MLRLQWNALRTGHKVFLHDQRDVEMRLLPGVVAMVQTQERSNDVGIRLTPNGERRGVLRPPRLTVHLVPLDPTEDCWRCDAVTAATGRRPGMTTEGGP
jgi:hypothetical protein